MKKPIIILLLCILIGCKESKTDYSVLDDIAIQSYKEGWIKGQQVAVENMQSNVTLSKELMSRQWATDSITFMHKLNEFHQ